MKEACFLLLHALLMSMARLMVMQASACMTMSMQPPDHWDLRTDDLNPCDMTLLPHHQKSEDFA